MELIGFSVYDEKAKAYLPVFFMQNVPVAVRSFSNSVNDSGQQIGRNPEDYTLFQMCVFDDSTGVIYPEIELIGNGLQFKRNEL